jgi:hypothetical protein
MPLWRIASLIAAGTAFAFAGASAAPAPANDIDTFVSTYRCTVTESLARIHASHKQDDRYFVLENGLTHQYVQCLFFDHDRRMLCEAWSGWWDQKNSGPHFKSPLAPEKLAALAKLGFSMDVSHGNFKRRFLFRYDPDYGEVADLMLKTLYSGFGTTLATGVKGEGPYAMRKSVLPKNTCIPIS